MKIVQTNGRLFPNFYGLSTVFNKLSTENSSGEGGKGASKGGKD
jgi:hypothetical protein